MDGALFIPVILFTTFFHLTLFHGLKILSKDYTEFETKCLFISTYAILGFIVLVFVYAKFFN